MDIGFLLKGLVIGFSIAAPVGPIGILCIKRSLVYGRVHGLVSGLGAATADALYGCIAGFGLAFVSNFLVSKQVYLAIIGGIFLCYMGVRSFLAPAVDDSLEPEKQSLLGAYSSTFFFTVTNPVTILTFTAVFAGLGLASSAGDYGSAMVLVLGVFLGSASWWTILSGGVSLLRSKVNQQAMQWVNRISGVIIFVFGIAAIANNIMR